MLLATILLLALLACSQSVNALSVAVSQISCTRLYFTLTLTPAEIRGASNLGVIVDDNIVSEVGLSGSFTTTDSAEFYAAFFDATDITSGAIPVTFSLLDEDDTALPAFANVTQTLTFQCGTIITTSAAVASATGRGPAPTTAASSTRAATSSSITNSSNPGNLSSSSSSSTGAIAGGVVGGIVVLAIAAIIAACMIRKKRRNRATGHNEVDEAAFRGPNNDSNVSLASAPENANTPMMRNVGNNSVFASNAASGSGSKNVFADPSVSGVSGAESGSSGSGSGAGVAAAGAGAAAAGGMGAAAIAARKESREELKPSNRDDAGPSTFEQRNASTPPSSATPTTPSYPASYPNMEPTQAASAAPAAAAAGAAATGKGSKWGFNKRGSQTAAESATPADTLSLASTTPSYASGNGAESPSRSFNVLHKPTTPANVAGPSNKSAAPIFNSRTRPTTSKAPSVASMTAGFADAPPMPSSDSVSSAPISESGNMAGVGAGRAYNISSGNSTKWHQQSYNIMPNFSARTMPRSTRLEEDLIFGHLGMGLSPPAPAAPFGSESGSSKSRKDPFGDR